MLPDAETRRRPDERDAGARRARLGAARRSSEDLRRARALLAEAMPAGDAETIAYCAQFLGSVGEMLGDRDLTSAARVATEPGGALLLAGLLDRRLARGAKQGRLSLDQAVASEAPRSR